MNTRKLPLILIAMGWAGAAHADLEICNESSVKRSVAIGYQGDDNWVSEGWWNLSPGQCQTVVGGDLAQRYYYYRATADDFEFVGEDYYFCTRPTEFTIVGDENCEDRGFEESDFREIDTGKTARSYTLTLEEEPREQSGAAPKQSSETPRQGGSGSGSGAEVMQSGFEHGSLGEPFSDVLIFQGCEIEDGAEYCAFHGGGWKYFAYAGGPTPDAFLQKLYDVRQGVAMHVEGDILNFGDITFEVALSSATYAPDADPFHETRDLLQGEWVSLDDSDYTTEVFGSESWDFHRGEFAAHHYLRVARACDGAPEGTTEQVLIQTTPETQESYCYGIAAIDADRLDLIYFGSGSLLRFGRP
ncbi:MAG: DUF1036 domain-containing protein [Thalassovita sp.]